MSSFVERVHSYPLVNDSCNAITDLYNASKSISKVGPVCEAAEQVANKVASHVKVLTDKNPVLAKVDSIACNYLLDPLESKVVQVKYPSEQLLGPVANYAVEKAEKIADLVLPTDQNEELPETDSVTSRQLRVARLKDRVAQKFTGDFSRLIEEVQRIVGMIVTGADLVEIKKKILYIISLLDSRFRALMDYLPGPKETIDHLRALLDKLLNDLSLANLKDSLSFKKLQELLESLSSQFQALTQPSKKVSQTLLDDSQEVAEVKIVEIHARASSPFKENELREEQLFGGEEESEDENRSQSDSSEFSNQNE